MATSRKLLKSPIWPALLCLVLGPGIGQIFNRDYKKAAVLIVVSIGSFLWFSKVVTEQISLFLPGSPETWVQNPDAMRPALMKLINQQPDMFFTFQLLLIVTWVYGVVDAYISAKKKLLPQPVLDHEDADTLR